jgi:hypothetical protein
MLRKVLITLPVLVFAFGILLTSILRTASVKYEFNGKIASNSQDMQVLGEEDIVIDYYLVYTGRVLPGSPLWFVKALRDKIWLLLTTNSSRKAELKLLFADKRLGAAKILFEKGKAGVGFSTLTKAEKYLEEAVAQESENRNEGDDTSEFLVTLAKASLKHFQVMEEIVDIAPEDAKPKVIEIQSYPKRAFEESRNALLEIGKTPPENPFGWQ